MWLPLITDHPLVLVLCFRWLSMPILKGSGNIRGLGWAALRLLSCMGAVAGFLNDTGMSKIRGVGRAPVVASRQGVRLLRLLCPAPSTRRRTAAWPSPIANLRRCWGGLRVFQRRDGIFIFRLAACMCLARCMAHHTCGGRVGHCCTGNNRHTHTVTGHVWLIHGGHARLKLIKWRLFQRHLSQL